MTTPVYRMARHPGPESEVTVTARCMDAGCGWESPPAPAARADVGCASHTAATGHGTFAVCLEYIALVTGEAWDEGGRGPDEALIRTPSCCGATARQAYERGCEVVFGSDVTATDDKPRQEPEPTVLP